jgi:uncharacterized protein (TIGR00159 family)
MIFLFNIGFLPIGFWDVIDILIVGYLIFRIYKLLKGSIAFNIFIGVVMIFLVWWLVTILKMDLLSMLLGQFVNVGFIIIIIIFQPEVRRFLLFLGNSTLRGRSNVLGKWLAQNIETTSNRQLHVQEIKSAILRMSKDKTGALIVLSGNLELESVGHSGIQIDSQISAPLLVSIFQKDSPMHDGAVVIGKGKILASGCILPVSESPLMPKSAGLRHRAALGISERTTASAIVVSEESGTVSFATEGRFESNLNEQKLTDLLYQYYS